MKVGYEVVNGDLDSIQPHQPWDCSFTKPNVENQCVNLESNELSAWVEHITKQLIEDDFPESGSDAFQTDSSMGSSEDNVVVPSLIGDLKANKVVLKSCCDVNEEELHWNNGIQLVHTEHGKSTGLSKLDEHGLTLISRLFECAVAISVDNLSEAHRMLLELTQMASPYGLSCAERVVAYFAKAMASRVINSWLGICFPLVNYKSVHSAFQVFNNSSPFIKFAHFTSNQAILEAFHRRDRVHIVDLDIMQGLQWPALFHILASRVEGPPHVRMSAIGSSMELLVETGTQLSSFARRLGISFEFHPVVRKYSEIESSMIQVRHGETLAVHWLQHSMYDATGPDWKTVRLIQELRPKIFTLVEQDIYHAGSFLDRFVGSLHYYSTVFDSLGAYLPNDEPSRHRVEQSLLYTEINNILAIGGPSRSGEDKFQQWRSELRNCLIQCPMSGNSMAQAQLILNMFSAAQGFSLVQGENGTLRLGWKDTSLYTASAWTCSSATC